MNDITHKGRGQQEDKVRINKYLASLGVASRRAIDSYIISGRISVNGKKVLTPGILVSSRDKISVDGVLLSLEHEPERIYILLNKPKGYLTTAHDEHGRRNVIDLISLPERIFPVGRLDMDTTGVLLLTNDGEWANTLMHPRYEKEKLYNALLDEELTQDDLMVISGGIILDRRRTAPCKITYSDQDRKLVQITLKEGKNRQIHRMFESKGYQILELTRIGYAGITTRGLKPGEWRYLTDKEIDALS